jgi:hypothetical protein
MTQFLTYLLIAAMAAVLIVLALGLANLLSKSSERITRSNQLMRLRVLTQFIAIVILVALGAASGMVG